MNLPTHNRYYFISTYTFLPYLLVQMSFVDYDVNFLQNKKKSYLQINIIIIIIVNLLYSYIRLLFKMELLQNLTNFISIVYNNILSTIIQNEDRCITESQLSKKIYIGIIIFYCTILYSWSEILSQRWISSTTDIDSIFKVLY